MTTFATVAGIQAEPLKIRVPPSGPWYAEGELETDTVLEGRVEARVGEVSFRGAVDVHGAFGGRGGVRVIAGAGRWAATVAKKHYHSDNGVRAALVAGDLAREVGETLASEIVPGSERVGIDFVRADGPAARALRQAIGSASWWVDYDGVTQIGTRTPSEVSGAYEVLTADPQRRTAVVSVDSVDTIRVGSVLRDKLPTPLVVWSLTIIVDGGVRIAVSGYPLSQILAAIAREAFPRAAFAFPYRYRVTDHVGARVRLQAVRLSPGLPDILHVSIQPGVAGVTARFRPGAQVLVQFIEGDPAQPIVTHAEGEGGEGWRPLSLVLDASTTLQVGPSADMVELGSGSETYPAQVPDPSGRVIRWGDVAEIPGVGPVPLVPQSGSSVAKVRA